MRAILHASLAAFALMTTPSAVSAADLSVNPPAPAPGNIPTTDAPSYRDLGAIDKTCLAWTDGCRSCQREADNTVNCSNIGIACQPSADSCTARRESAK